MTDDILEQFKKSLTQVSKGEKNALAEMVEITLGRKKSNVITGAQYCSVVRWFNLEVINALLSGTSEQGKIILSALQGLPYVHEINPLGYAYRSDVRKYLSDKLSVENKELYIELHQKAHDYFDQKLGSQGVTMDEVSWATLTQEQVDYLREKLYHLLYIQLDLGFDLMDRLLRGAHRYRLFGEMATLIGFGKEHAKNSLSTFNSLRLRYYTAVLDYANGEWEVAINALQDILAYKELLPEFRARVLSQLGTIFVSSSQFQQGIDALKKSKQMWDNLEDIQRSSALANNLGNAYLANGNINQAEKFFLEGLIGLTKAGGGADVAIAYNNLGNIYAHKEDWKKALDYYSKSLKVKQQAGDHFGAATTQMNLGTILQRMSQDSPGSRQEAELRSQAIDYYTRSIATFRQLSARSRLARTLYKLAVTYRQAGQTNLARQNAQEALAIFVSLNLPEQNMASKLITQLGEASQP